MIPSFVSVSRDMPSQITVFPGTGQCERDNRLTDRSENQLWMSFRLPKGGRTTIPAASRSEHVAVSSCNQLAMHAHSEVSIWLEAEYDPSTLPTIAVRIVGN
jgi:hypothetical protein